MTEMIKRTRMQIARRVRQVRTVWQSEGAAWLGDRARKGLEAYGESDELDNMVIDHPGDVVDAEQDRYLAAREMSIDADYYESEGDSDVESLRGRERHASRPRTMSEGVMDRMEL